MKDHEIGLLEEESQLILGRRLIWISERVLWLAEESHFTSLDSRAPVKRVL